MNEDDRTTAIGLARYARDFYDAAIAADHVLGRRRGYEIVAPAPVMLLVPHSIELALKAYLRHQGFTVKGLKRIGHDLNDCWKVATDNEIEDHVSLSQEERSTLSLISDLHMSTQLRYIQTVFKTYPVFGPLQDVTNKLLDAICPLVGYR